MLLLWGFAFASLFGTSLDCAQAAGKLQELDLPVAHVRASRAVAMFHPKGQPPGLFTAGVKITADDAKGTIHIKGTKDDLAVAQSFLLLVDVEHPAHQLKFHVDSPTDHIAYDLTATLRNNETWQTSEDETGLSMTIKPRFDDAGEMSAMVVLNYDGGSQETSFRLAPGKSFKIVLGNKISSEIHATASGKQRDISFNGVKTPTVTVEYVKGR